MRKIIMILCFALFPVCGIKAQYADAMISVSDVAVTESDGMVSVAFRVEAARKSVSGSKSIVWSPVLTDGIYRVTLPAVIVRNRRGDILAARYEWSAGQAGAQPLFVLKPGTGGEYEHSVPAQKWMRNAFLIAESIDWGCTCSNGLPVSVLAANILTEKAEATKGQITGQAEAGTVPDGVDVAADTAVEAGPGAVAGPKTTGDMLATTFPFVALDSGQDIDNPLYDEDTKNAIVIYCKVNSSSIDPGFMDNKERLASILDCINKIKSSGDCEISNVVVAGFASPEGYFADNDRLAWERAVSIKEYIMKHGGLESHLVKIHNGSVDWRGLRALIVASDMPGKKEVVDIIDGTPIWDSQRQVGRLGQIMRLNGGDTYRYMSKHFFPRLRNASFIKIYYKNN